ncbi:MAG: AraC family transcriptional regulator [Dysgonamonadaceae bacterium]
MIKQIESIKSFSSSITDRPSPLKEFYINKREEVPVHSCLSSYRRDFYKISFITKGTGILTYGNNKVDIQTNTLIISNPNTPFLWQPTSEEQAGFFCLFTYSLLNANQHSNSPLYSLLNGSDFVFPLKGETTLFFQSLFEKLYANAQSEYILKYDLFQNYMQIILHEIVKEFGITNFETYNSSERISRKFLNLLESEFSINSVNTEIKLKTPTDFAQRLSVHVNHLNRALKEHTERTTTELITERIVREAQSLLSYTDWSISEITYCLGFKHPSSFQSFFKRHTNLSPKEYRKTII